MTYSTTVSNENENRLRQVAVACEFKAEDGCLGLLRVARARALNSDAEHELVDLYFIQLVACGREGWD